MTEKLHFSQAARQDLIVDPVAEAFKKKSRILAIMISEPFTVETDRGIMTGEAGDYLVTNHPDDDPGSDLWSISAERMNSTYERV